MNTINENKPKPILHNFVDENDETFASKRLCEIVFQGKVRMFDYAKMSENILAQKPRTPQLFGITQHITLEMIEDTDPYTLGITIKDTYAKLKAHMNQYTNEPLDFKNGPTK